MDVIAVGKSKQLFYSFPEHKHGYWEILLNVQGSGDMTVDGRVYRFTPGDIVVIPPFAAHKKVSEEGFRDMGMFINQFPIIGKTRLKFFRDDEENSVRQIMEMALRYYQANSKSNLEQSAVNVMSDLIYQLLVCFYNKGVQNDIRLEALLELMNSNIANPHFNLTTAIDEIGYSRGYLRRLFKIEMGTSPVSYFNQLRIAHAKSIFQQFGNSRSISHIATESGFSDSLYFSRVFKSIEGICPKDYVIQIMQKDEEPIFIDMPKEF